MSDEELMWRVVAGDMEALGTLFERYKHAVHGFLARLLHDGVWAEDVLLDAFLRVYDRRHTYRQGSKFSTWLYAIAHHLAIDRLRRFTHYEQPAREMALPIPQNEPARLCEQAELAGAVQTALKALPDDQRAVIILREYEGFSYREIAQVTGASEAAVRVRAHRARQALRKTLEPYLQDLTEAVTFSGTQTYK